MRSPFGQVIENCQILLGRINDIKLHFIKRSAKRVVHQLARIAYLYRDRSFDRIPTKVMICILEDLSS